MAKILLKTYCISAAGGGFEQYHQYYNTDVLPADYTANPLTEESAPAITCTPYYLPDGTFLESYCALNSQGKGVKRTITAKQGIPGYLATDTDSTDCDGTCDLNITYQQGLPTSAFNTADGSLVIEATTSHPPIDLFVANLNTPNPVRFNPGLLPAAYQWNFKDVPAGNYQAQLRDDGNCQKNTNTLTVAKGNALGAGGNGGINNGMPSNITWIKYEHRFSTSNNGGDAGTISGWAWDKTRKEAYYVAPTALKFAAFNNRRDYAKGDIVSWIPDGQDQRFYYRATQNLEQRDTRFDSDDHRIPNPHPENIDRGYWEYVTPRNTTWLQFLYKERLLNTIFDPFFQRKTSQPGGDYHFFYPEGTIVRYDWAGFYRAKKGLESNLFPGSTLPTPTVGQSNDNWEKLNGYEAFYYAVPEGEVIDQYDIGTVNRSVRAHVASPDDEAQVYGPPLFLPNRDAYVPTSSSWYKTPANDYILFDDVEPTVETQLGDLKVIDIIKNDIDVPGAENGSVWVMAESPSPPVRYHLRNGVRPGYVQDNLTGIFENLHPGGFIVDVYDAKGRYVTAEFTISDNYRPRWRLNFDNQRSTKKQAVVYERGWTGEVTDVIGTESPIKHSWDTGDATGKSLPNTLGSSLNFDLYTSVAQQFVDTATRDDRSHRVDFTSNGQLEFRGYVIPTLYEEAMLGPGQRVTLIAACGLAQLNNTKWINHLRERQVARTNMLSVVLKCLSFCDVNLPVWCGLNLRDKLMAADGDPLELAYIHRNAFNKKNGKVVADEDIIDCRAVVDGILRSFNAYLTQAAGCWKILSYSEVHDDYAVRVWSPAGVLQTDVDTTPTPVRILPPTDATGPNELFWISAGQKRYTTPEAQLVKATNGLQLEETLLRNGDFVEWDSSLTRPLYWTVEGNTTVKRALGEKAREYAVQFSNYNTTLRPNTGLLSPAAPHLPGQDEDVMVLKFKAKLTATTVIVGSTGKPDERSATLFFQIVCDGVNYGALLSAEVSTKEGWKEQTIYLPTGLPGTSVRLRMLPPVATDTVSASTTLALNNLSLAIQPGRVTWPESDHFEVFNNVNLSGVVLDDVELIVADLPLLPDRGRNPLPPKKMDVFAWRHAISLADYSPTSAWARPGYKNRLPMLDNAAQDRMIMYQVPGTILKGTVKGPGISVIRAGQMLDAPADVDGKFFILNCIIDERRGTAEITARKLADGGYGGEDADIPDGVRIALNKGKEGYRIALVNGVEGYRIAKR
jgi:hypothetical protein